MALNNDPRHGEGWDDLLEGDYDALYAALETNEHGEIQPQAYGFDTMHELVDYMEKNNFEIGEEDRERKKRQLHNDQWKIPSKLNQISEYLENEALTPSEIQLDPSAETELTITQRPSDREDKDVLYTAHFAAYDEDQRSSEANFYIAGSWYDTPPEQINFEDIFNATTHKQQHEEEEE